MHMRAAFVVVAAVGAVQASATADMVSLNASQDNTVYSESDALSNGAGRRFFAGRNNVGELRRGLIAFDIAGSGIPAGSTIDSVMLQLNMSRTEAGNETVSLHLLTADWGEGASDAPGQEGGGDAAEDGDATWHYRFYDTADPPSGPIWATDGGDYVGAASANTVVGDLGHYSWGSTGAMVADVQGWLDNPATNFGWIMIGNEGADKTSKRFDSRQENNSANWPKLAIVFTPPAVWRRGSELEL